ncbi:MAG: hypothetical protein FRX49_11888, partial [Trebouxia sp. A1-2]
MSESESDSCTHIAIQEVLQARLRNPRHVIAEAQVHVDDALEALVPALAELSWGVLDTREHGWQTGAVQERDVAGWSLRVDCDGWAGMRQRRPQCSQCIQSGSFDAQRFKHVSACGDAEHLSMGSLRSDSIPGFELQQHWQVGLKVAGMGHSVQQPLKHAVTDVRGGQLVAHLPSDKIACLIWVHGDHAQHSRGRSMPDNADIAVAESLVAGPYTL